MECRSLVALYLCGFLHGFLFRWLSYGLLLEQMPNNSPPKILAYYLYWTLDFEEFLRDYIDHEFSEAMMESRYTKRCKGDRRCSMVVV